MKCETRGCAFPALQDDKYCRNHTMKVEIPKRAGLPAALPVSNEYEIVQMDKVPKFNIRNEKNFHIAQVIASLTNSTAVKIHTPAGKVGGYMNTNIKSYLKKLGVKTKHVRNGDHTFFWKV